MEQVKEFKTHTERTREVQSNQVGHVCQLLGIDKDGYCWHQYKQYELFLAMVCMDYPTHLRRLRYSATFRTFWVNEWANRNQVDFLPFAYDCKYDKAEVMAEYKHVHSAERLYNDELFYYRFESILKFIKAEEAK